MLGNIKIGRCCCWEILRSPDAAGKYQDRARLLLGNIEIEQCGRTMLSGKERALPGQRETPSTKCASTTAQAPSSQAPSHTEPRTNGKYQRKGSSQAPSPQSTENINGKYQRKRSSTKPHGAKPSVRKHHRLKAPCRLASTIVN